MLFIEVSDVCYYWEHIFLCSLLSSLKAQIGLSQIWNYWSMSVLVNNLCVVFTIMVRMVVSSQEIGWEDYLL